MINKINKFFIIIFFLLLSASTVLSQTKFSSNTLEAEEILTQGLSEKNPEKRKEAVVALSLAGNNIKVISLLTRALKDPDVNVRLAACASLAEIKDNRAITVLEESLNDPVAEVTFAAAQALWQMNQNSGKEVLMAVLAGEQKTSSSYLSKQKRDTMRMMKNPSGLFKFILKTGIGFVPVPGVEAGFTSMEELLKNSNISGRALAALLLAKDNDPDSLELLKDALIDKDWSVRAAAAHAIALRNQPGASKSLTPLFQDKKEEVRFRAAAAYLRLEFSGKNFNSKLRKKNK
ncbi:MAG: HEAT repeat domain-containing protein [Acidobacteria bacterium]|nr:HEAT repeat domain-containing protein [Acidobacteriota bacterium]